MKEPRSQLSPEQLTLGVQALQAGEGLFMPTQQTMRGEKIKSVYDYSQAWPRQQGTELSLKGRPWL